MILGWLLVKVSGCLRDCGGGWSFSREGPILPFFKAWYSWSFSWEWYGWSLSRECEGGLLLQSPSQGQESRRSRREDCMLDTPGDGDWRGSCGKELKRTMTWIFPESAPLGRFSHYQTKKLYLCFYLHRSRDLLSPVSGFFTFTISLFWCAWSCTLDGFKSLVCEMFTNHKFTLKINVLEPQINPCYRYLEQQEN